MEVRCYERAGAAAPYTYTLAATAPGAATTLTISNLAVGTHTYIVRSWNGQQESADSNAVSATILPVPSSPTTLTIVVTVQ